VKRAALFALAVLLVAAVSVRFASASFSSATANPANALTSATLGAPSGLTGAASGNDVALSWTAGSGASDYAIRGAANGTSSSCTGVALSALATTTATSRTDTSRSTPAGTYYCYAVQSTYRSWTSAFTPAAAVQLGVVARAVTFTNAANTAGCSSLNGAGWVDCGDRIVIDFNQAIDPTTGPQSANTVCAGSGTIVLGAIATTGGCTTTEASNLGVLSGVTMTNVARFSGTYSWSNANRTLTVEVRGRLTGSRNVQLAAGSLTFAPSTDAADLRSAVGAVHTCDTNTGGSNCRPVATGTL
jgi:hypothetical protein